MPDSLKPFEVLYLSYEGDAIPFAVKRSARRKTCAVVVQAEGIHIAAPEGINLEQIKLALQSKMPQIAEAVAKSLAQRSPPRARNYVSGESLRLLGKPYILWVSTETVEAVTVKGNRVYVGQGTAIEVRSALEGWYKSQAEQVFIERVTLWAKRLGVTPNQVLIRSQKTRWGSCDHLGNLRLNWRLVMAPISLVDYVVAHELAHLRAPNHSPQFWAILRSVMPDYPHRKNRLAEIGEQLFVFEQIGVVRKNGE